MQAWPPQSAPGTDNGPVATLGELLPPPPPLHDARIADKPNIDNFTKTLGAITDLSIIDHDMN